MKLNLTKTQRRFLIVLILALVVCVTLGIIYDKTEYEKQTEIKDLPGEANTDDYHGLVITEVFSNNGGLYVNENNETCDYIELYNGSQNAIDLAGYGLTDKGEKIKWNFPKVTIEPGQYLVVNLTGKSESGLNANFKLSSKGGENIYLLNSNGKVLDVVETLPLAKNTAMTREGNEWIIVKYATPGFENTQSGYEQYLAQLLAGEDETALVINEFLVKNKGNYLNENGRYDGYIEFKNISNEIIDLSQYYISNDQAVPFKAKLGEGKLAPGEIKLVYMGEASAFYDNYSSFNLNNVNGSVILAKSGKIVKAISYEGLTNGVAYIRNSDGSYYQSATISPGYENTYAGVDSFAKEELRKQSGLIISEVMSVNSLYLPQNGAKYYDWIEIQNNTNSDINLDGYCLSTDDARLDLYKLPNVTLKAGEYFIVMCSGDEGLTNDTYYHAGFKLGNAESIYISKDGNIVDSIFAYDIPVNYSLGRGSEYGLYYCAYPSPLRDNNPGSQGVSPQPEILSPAGSYDGVSSVSVELSGPGTIYYTVDGSLPTIYSNVYTGPITLTSTAVVKAACKIEGQELSDRAVSYYLINDPQVLPVVNISLNSWDYNHLLADPTNRELTFQADLTIIEDGEVTYCPCGLSLSGLTGRLFTKKNMAFHFESKWGASDLVYKMFEDVDSSRFDSLTIRGGSNADDTLPWKDEFATELAKDYLTVRAYKTVAFYINNDFKGVYNVREKINAQMITNQFNVDPERLTIERWTGYLEHGTEEKWLAVMEWAKTHDLSDPDNYAKLGKMVDIQGLVDLWIFEAFIDNPDIYNIRVFSHPDIDDGQWKFIYFDLDLGGYCQYYNYIRQQVFSPSGIAHDLGYQPYDVGINNALLANADFRKLFMERLEYHLANNLSQENIARVYDSFVEVYKDQIERDFVANYYYYPQYLANVEHFREYYLSQGAEILWETQDFFAEYEATH